MRKQTSPKYGDLLAIDEESPVKTTTICLSAREKSHYKSLLLTTPVDQSVQPMSFKLWWRCIYIQSIEWSAPVMKCFSTGKLQATKATAYTPCGGKTIEVKLAKYTHLYPQFKMVYVRLRVGSFEPEQKHTKRMGK